MGRLATLRPRVAKVAGRQLQSMQAGSWRTDGMTSGERGYNYKWQQARLAYLKKHPLCVMCRAEQRVTAATVVDHVKPHRGDMALFWDRSNWCALCAHHHSSTKQRMENQDA